MCNTTGKCMLNIYSFRGKFIDVNVGRAVRPPNQTFMEYYKNVFCVCKSTKREDQSLVKIAPSISFVYDEPACQYLCAMMVGSINNVDAHTTADYYIDILEKEPSAAA